MPTAAAPPRAFEDIRSQLRARIGRQWKPGDRLPSVRDLARQLGAGHVNTHRAVKALAREGVLVARHRVGVFVAMAPATRRLVEEPAMPPSASRHLSHPLAALRIHVLCGINESVPQAARLARGFTSVIERHHCDVTCREINMTRMEWHNLAGEDCEAVAILSPLGGRRLRLRPNLPVVVAHQGVNPSIELASVTDFDLVGVDNEHGGIMAGRCMRDAGVEDVVVIGRQYKDPDPQMRREPRPMRYDDLSAARLAGFERGFGKPIDSAHRFMAGYYGPGPAARLVPDFLALRPRPLGVFATTDDLAMGFIHGAQSHGLEPGRDFHIIGFDGQQAGRNLHEGPLTTIDLLLEEMGRCAADLLAERMLNPSLPRRQIAIGCRLFPGATVRHHIGKGQSI